MARRLGIRLLQSLGLMPVAYLFVCLMNAAITQTPFTLKVPELNQLDSDSTLELLLFCIPGQVLFVVLSLFGQARRWLLAGFTLCAVITAWLQCLLFAEGFGNTWSTTELIGLLAMNLPWLLLALLPGLAWVIATQRLRKQLN